MPEMSELERIPEPQPMATVTFEYTLAKVSIPIIVPVEKLGDRLVIDDHTMSDIRTLANAKLVGKIGKKAAGQVISCKTKVDLIEPKLTV